MCVPRDHIAFGVHLHGLGANSQSLVVGSIAVGVVEEGLDSALSHELLPGDEKRADDGARTHDLLHDEEIVHLPTPYGIVTVL